MQKLNSQEKSLLFCVVANVKGQDNPEKRFWDMLSRQDGRAQILDLFQSRAFLRDMRLGKQHALKQQDAGLEIQPLDAETLRGFTALLKNGPEAIGLFADRKKRLARKALIRYVDKIETSDLEKIRENAAFLGHFLGRGILMSRRDRTGKMEKLFLYLGSVVYHLGTNPVYAERAEVALREISTLLANVERRVLSAKDTITGGPCLSSTEGGTRPTGKLTDSLFRNIRSVIWEKNVKDPAGSGRAMAIRLNGEWPIEDGVPSVKIFRTIHILGFTLAYLAKHYVAVIMSADSIKSLRSRVGFWETTVSEMGLWVVPTDLIELASLNRKTDREMLLYVYGETGGSVGINPYLLTKEHGHKRMKSQTGDVYLPVPNMSNMLCREADGALLEIAAKSLVPESKLTILHAFVV